MATTYYMRAYDSGTAGYVVWTTGDPTATPAAGDTTPNYTGALSAQAVEAPDPGAGLSAEDALALDLLLMGG